MERQMEGYMTVEISLLFPIVFLGICAMAFMGIYFHDRVVSQSFLYKFCLHSTFYEEDTMIKERKLSEELGGNLLFSRVEEAVFSESDSEIKGQADMCMEIPFFLIKKQYYHSEVKVQYINKAMCLRKEKAFREVTSE